ncbi:MULTISPECIES: condensation domain-containing protein [Photorhabdus]|uniref:Six-domain nonribosomal peptide synthetase n=2 Tax=Photorhabdus asymbiotica TaxID=291112 RepID=C7BMY7_PHOAA|nr:condensation domain-containing protein [Photorhabdus asymbiotica]RKS57710.1 condensation domain-containing protein [Photorhabdus asymbiotica]CAQ82973.1 six-domain nonribosomal peptide synthetase [Photorhabdus asymbiotica]
MRELTTMQAAYWVGRQYEQTLGGVTAHLYAEFDGTGLDLERLKIAVQYLFDIHPMLRLRVTPDGMQTIESLSSNNKLHIDDVSIYDEKGIADFLERKRKSKTHQRLDLEHGQPIDLSVTLLKDGDFRLHVDLDMIAGDAQSFRILMEDLARFYHQPEHQPKEEGRTYFHYLERMQADKLLLALRERDKKWWSTRIAQIPQAPKLPHMHRHFPTGEYCSDRLAVQLTKEEKQSLKATAKEYQITLSTLFLSLFACTVGICTQSDKFRLNVPTFQREYYLGDVDKIVGDFSDLFILSVELQRHESMVTLCHHFADQIALLLSHRAYPGVSVMRDLSRYHGNMQISPIVFTSGFGISGDNLFSENVTRAFGEMTFVISQGPQVALDVQVAPSYEGILVNWDVRLDIFPEPYIRRMFDTYLSLIRMIIRSPELINQPLDYFFSSHFSALHQDVDTEKVTSSCVEKMLILLLSRLTNEENINANTSLSALDIDVDVAEELTAFINKYIPQAELIIADIKTHRTLNALAQTITLRSQGMAEKTAEALLKILSRPK